METNTIELRLKLLEKMVVKLEQTSIKNALHNLKLSNWLTYLDSRIRKIGDETPPLGTKRPQIQKSRDKTSPPVSDWSEPWKPIVGPVFKPAKSYWDFEKRFLLKPNGPTKYIERVINLLMAYPENHNFYVKSKRCYVSKDHQWEPMMPKDFYPALREKILNEYCNLVLRGQGDDVEKFARDCLKRASLEHWTNKKLEVVFSNKSDCRTL